MLSGTEKPCFLSKSKFLGKILLANFFKKILFRFFDTFNELWTFPNAKSITFLSKNGERWKIIHQVFNESGKLSAIIKVYGAWIDLTKRKLTTPPIEAQQLFDNAERSEDFEEISLRK